MHKIKPGFITSNLKLGEERPGLHCKYSTTCSNMDGLGTVYLERIRIKRANPMQIALPCCCKIEFGALSKDSITEKNSAIAADEKMIKKCSIILGSVLYSKILKTDVGIAKNYLKAAET